MHRVFLDQCANSIAQGRSHPRKGQGRPDATLVPSPSPGKRIADGKHCAQPIASAKYRSEIKVFLLTEIGSMLTISLS